MSSGRLRRLLLGGAVAAILAAAAIVPMPLVAIEPGGAEPVAPRVRLGVPAHPVNGQYLLTTVRLAEPPAAGVLAAWIDPKIDLEPRPAVIPPGVPDEQYVQAQLQLFRESSEVAAAVALRAAGFPVKVSGSGARVVGVIAGSPADGVLREGDIIIAVDGRPVRSASDVAEATARAGDGGGAVAVTFRRGDETRTATIRPGRVSQVGRPALGVALESTALRIELPFPVEVDQSGIGGPSAGLMMALTIYDLVEPGDLAKGRTIAGTGTIDLAGKVGPVGGVRQKIEAAKAARAKVFIVPEVEADEAREAAGDRLAVKPVSTFSQALEALGIPPEGAIMRPEE
jgi:PDZ domain-containing protein